MPIGYVPPHKRNEVEKKPKLVSMTSKDDFPELSSGAAKTSAWGAKASFSQKIKDLIAFEKKTVVEREAEIEAARAIAGWVVLDIRPFTKERYILFNERMLGLALFEEAQKIKIESATKNEDVVASPKNEPFVELAYDSPSEEEEDRQESDDKSEETYDEPYEDDEEYIETYDKYY